MWKKINDRRSSANVSRRATTRCRVDFHASFVQNRMTSPRLTSKPPATLGTSIHSSTSAPVSDPDASPPSPRRSGSTCNPPASPVSNARIVSVVGSVCGFTRSTIVSSGPSSASASARASRSRSRGGYRNATRFVTCLSILVSK
eukprot:31408-Pelagococcus_subviridis.AAC.18